MTITPSFIVGLDAADKPVWRNFRAMTEQDRDAAVAWQQRTIGRLEREAFALFERQADPRLGRDDGRSLQVALRKGRALEAERRREDALKGCWRRGPRRTHRTGGPAGAPAGPGRGSRCARLHRRRACGAAAGERAGPEPHWTLADSFMR
jgi:hypothetical protein